MKKNNYMLTPGHICKTDGCLDRVNTTYYPLCYFCGRIKMLIENGKCVLCGIQNIHIDYFCENCFYACFETQFGECHNIECNNRKYRFGLCKEHYDLEKPFNIQDEAREELSQIFQNAEEYDNHGLTCIVSKTKNGKFKKVYDRVFDLISVHLDMSYSQHRRHFCHFLDSYCIHPFHILQGAPFENKADRFKKETQRMFLKTSQYPNLKGIQEYLKTNKGLKILIQTNLYFKHKLREFDLASRTTTEKLELLKIFKKAKDGFIPIEVVKPEPIEEKPEPVKPRNKPERRKRIVGRQVYEGIIRYENEKVKDLIVYLIKKQKDFGPNQLWGFICYWAQDKTNKLELAIKIYDSIFKIDYDTNPEDFEPSKSCPDILKQYCDRFDLNN